MKKFRLFLLVICLFAIVGCSADENNKQASKNNNSITITPEKKEEAKTNEPTIFPTEVITKQNKIIDITAGFGHIVGIRQDGSVIVWGNNDRGQCEVPEGLSNVISVCTGDQHTVALKNDGTVVAWGSNTARTPDSIAKGGLCNQSNIPKGVKDIKMISAGACHTAMLKNNGEIIILGKYISGLEGNESYVDDIPIFDEFVIPDDLSNINKIASGANHIVALKNDGTVVAWGLNDSGQCNVPDGLKNVKDICAGGDHTMALTEDGKVIAWGNSIKSQCDVPKDLPRASIIEAGFINSGIVTKEGDVIIWGDNIDNQCDVPSRIKNVKDLSIGRGYIVVLLEDNSIDMWGWDGYGIYNDILTIENEKISKANDVKTTIENFNNAIYKENIDQFKHLISPSGLVIIRNFVSGGYGQRGKNIRNCYLVSEIPDNLKFEVDDEVPIDLSELFPKKLLSEGIETDYIKLNGNTFGYKDGIKKENKSVSVPNPPTNEIIENCSEIMKYINDKNEERKLMVFILGNDEIALTEAQYYNGFSYGNWAIFEKINEKYYLRAIMDFR